MHAYIHLNSPHHTFIEAKGRKEKYFLYLLYVKHRTDTHVRFVDKIEKNLNQ